MFWQITTASSQRLALFPSDSHRRAAARTLARVGRDEVLLFCVADDHFHVLVAATQARAVRIAVNLALALQPMAAAPLAPAHVSAVNDRAHLATLVRYVLDQTSHHRLQTAEHPALWPGSSFADLVGARVLPGFDPMVLAEALPRLDEVQLFQAVRLPWVGHADDDALAGLGIDVLARCVADVVGRDGVADRRADGARVLVARLAHGFGVGSPRIARTLCTSERHARRLAARDADPRLEAALRRWVAIREEALRPRVTRSRTFSAELDATPG